jgi:hypothetical protein
MTPTPSRTAQAMVNLVRNMACNTPRASGYNNFTDAGEKLYPPAPPVQ